MNSEFEVLRDVVTRLESAGIPYMLTGRARRELGGAAAWVISKEDLILSKLAWAAPSESAFQLRDVRKLLASGADEAYLHHWSARLGVDVLLRRCMDAGHDS